MIPTLGELDRPFRAPVWKAQGPGAVPQVGVGCPFGAKSLISGFFFSVSHRGVGSTCSLLRRTIDP